jgi:hypothetical protein
MCSGMWPPIYPAIVNNAAQATLRLVFPWLRVSVGLPSLAQSFRPRFLPCSGYRLRYCQGGGGGDPSRSNGLADDVVVLAVGVDGCGAHGSPHSPRRFYRHQLPPLRHHRPDRRECLPLLGHCPPPSLLTRTAPFIFPPPACLVQAS